MPELRSIFKITLLFRRREVIIIMPAGARSGKRIRRYIHKVWTDMFRLVSVWFHR